MTQSAAQLKLESAAQSGAQSELESRGQSELQSRAQAGFRVGAGPSIPGASSTRVRRAATGGVERRAATSGSGTIAAATVASYDKVWDWLWKQQAGLVVDADLLGWDTDDPQLPSTITAAA